MRHSYYIYIGKEVFEDIKNTNNRIIHFEKYDCCLRHT